MGHSTGSMLGHWLLLVGCAAGVVLAVAEVGCTKPANVHDTAEARTRACASCHQGAYLAAKNPKHDGVMPQTCETCHASGAWVPAAGGAASHPWFKLANKHAPPTTCTQCHTKGYNPGDTPNTCVGCHQADYDGTTNPSHATAGFSTDCAGCHGDAAWSPATSSATGHQWWPLVGKHITTSCTSCHVGNPVVYAGTPRDCASCHKSAYDNATNPPHAGLPTTCETCHTPNGWAPSTFTHPWTLDGAHAQASCASCHTGTPPRYAGTPTACVDCHQSNAATADANVSGHSSYPRTCGDCHSTTSWSSTSGGGTHPEAAFPISAGVHSLGIACADCHIAANGSPKGGANTDCIHCHLGAHPRSAMDKDPKHSGLSGYPGASAPVNFCLNCHPKGTL